MRGLAAASGLLACMGAAAAHALSDDAREFSGQERAALQAGELVTRPQHERRGRAQLIGGLSWQLVDAPVEQIWQVISDESTYQHYLPAVVEARRPDVSDPHAPHLPSERLFIRHHVAFTDASYCVLADYDATAHRLSFRLDHSRPSSIRQAWGELRVNRYDDQRSVVSFAIMADLGSGLAVGLLRGEAHRWMLKVPELLKKYLVRRARKV